MNDNKLPRSPAFVGGVLVAAASTHQAIQDEVVPGRRPGLAKTMDGSTLRSQRLRTTSQVEHQTIVCPLANGGAVNKADPEPC